jgi:hypothetical protein
MRAVAFPRARPRWLDVLLWPGVALALSGCATGRAVQVDLGDGRVRSLGAIDGCDDFSTDPVVLRRGEPVNVLVHGCNASTGAFRTLAKVLRENGQQAVCFCYDDRHSLERSSARLLRALDDVREWTDAPQMTVIGHSQGGLVARRSLVEDRKDGRRLGDGAKVRLVTVSSPFNGIRSSKHCGIVAFHVFTLGVSAMVCQIIAGSKWHHIFPRAPFMRHPGELVDDVELHLEIVTDETGSCRRKNSAGQCVEDDFVFALVEQRNPAVDGDQRVSRVQIRAGHGEIVGSRARPPTKLLGVLREHHVLAASPTMTAKRLTALLAKLY